MVITHWPALVDLYLRVDVVHFGMHVLWVASGLLFWMPVLSPIPEYRRLVEPLQMGYLFLSSIIPPVPASFLTWAAQTLSDLYTEAPAHWVPTALHDVQARESITIGK